MRRSFHSFLIIFSSIIAVSALAEGDETINFREKCRRAVSGTFATVLADMHMADDGVTLAENFSKKARILEDSFELKMKALKKKIAANDYSPDLLNERDVIASQIKLYHEQLLTSQSQLETAKKQKSDANKRESNLRKKVEAIFTVIMSEDPDGGIRPLFNKLEWKSPCPKYRTLCPLPPHDAELLISLTDDMDDPSLVCHRYSKIK